MRMPFPVRLSLAPEDLRSRRFPGSHPSRVLALVTVVTASLALLVSAAPAAAAATTQTASCVDGGGVRWSATAVWGAVYASADGAAAVVKDYVGWTTTRAGTVSTDSSVKTYDGRGSLVQALTWTGSFDYGAGSTYKARNPANPPSSPGMTKVVLTLGVDGDGFGNCAVTFTQPGSSPLTASDRYEADILTATNTERTSRSLTALTLQSCVDRYAESQAAAMAAQQRMYHQDLGPILTDCRLMAAGENVAYGYADGRAATAGWMASPGHRANLLNARYRLIGVAASQDSDGRWYAAQVFGSVS